MTVYVDILIILNTLVNYFMLLAVKKITRENTSRLRLLFGALAGGVSSLLIFAEHLGVLMTVIKILTSLLMVLISFKFISFKKFLKNSAWLFFISFIFGGLMLAVYFCFNLDMMIYTNGIVYFDIDMTFLVVCSVLAYIVVTLITSFIDKKAPKEKEYYITIEKASKTVSCTAFMDTGNNLREPFSGYPVIMADATVFSQLFDDENEKIRLIPIMTVNGESVVKAFRPDCFRWGNYTSDRVYIAKSIAPLDEYKVILNVNLESISVYSKGS